MNLPAGTAIRKNINADWVIRLWSPGDLMTILLIVDIKKIRMFLFSEPPVSLCLQLT
jgi:hypothetical protein